MLIGRHSFIRQNKLSDVAGRIDYISNPKRQEHLYATYQTEGATQEFWKNLARENQLDFKTSGTTGKCIEGREFIIALPESFVEYKADDVVRLFTDSFHKRYDVECRAALHHNKKMTNYHIHLVFSERKMLERPEVKIATRNMFYDEQGKHRRTKKEILDEKGNIRTVDVALVEGVSEEDILKIKQEKITDKTLQSIRTHGWLPDMFRQIIRGAKDFLQEVIFKFKLSSRPVPKIDLQEWKDMQKIMYELQGQSREIKRTQQDISSLKKQLSQLRGLFKGKERKSLEGRIELLEDLEKRLHKSLEQIVKREGYPNVQAFQKVYNKAETLIMEYNEELRAWKNQAEQKKENPLEQRKKASVLEKLHRYQQEGRQQPKRSVKRKSMDRER